ncbi:hypothetical protein SAMN02949497_3436 [Methylomagnum ishizawai]|uniref:Uncharacterized protein n=1 Tax=Methylomagnum ishizawai TaxID=1760988 RepID=A0A1Y6D8B9_9GAMM|nr:hypothetical protein [Methylomagnum ishizawai]SMF96055.1 hypothetical protein SAMN02949497_3436 [Methylomagnum ishizawai]
MELSAKELGQLYTILKTLIPEAPPDLQAEIDALTDKIGAHFQEKHPQYFEQTVMTINLTLAQIKQFYGTPQREN